jgi:drug/metabolite transporter (DMT)-like permease
MATGTTSAPTEKRPRRLGLTERQIALALLFVAPALFASNMLMARATHDLIPPVALAFWRWTATLVLLLPFTAGALLRHRRDIAREWRDFAVLGALGMGVCGAFVYIGADTTTATNIGLIYAASPILIVLFVRFGYGEPLGRLQGLGVALSLAGVLAVVCRGDPHVLLGLRFSVGDLWILAAMVA